MKRYITIGLAIALVVIACGTDGSEAPGSGNDETTEPSQDEPVLTTIPTKPTPTASLPNVTAPEPSGSLAEAEESSRQLLMEMRGVSGSAIETIVAERVTWNDGSIGCPEPDVAYTQALVPGYRVVLGLDGVEYAFHGSEGGAMKYCATPSSGFNSNA